MESRESARMPIDDRPLVPNKVPSDAAVKAKRRREAQGDVGFALAFPVFYSPFTIL